jgi:hypothetical protein
MTSTAQTPVGQCAQPIVHEGNEPVRAAISFQQAEVSNSTFSAQKAL